MTSPTPPPTAPPTTPPVSASASLSSSLGLVSVLEAQPAHTILIGYAAEFDSERERKATGRPRWRSLLQPESLRKLRSICPGAAKLVGFRHACVGYFIAE